jgi:hypothetical protein
MCRRRILATSLAVLAAAVSSVGLIQAQSPSADANDFLRLIQTYRGKMFCAPPTATLKDAANVVSEYVRSHPELQGRYSDQQALQALANAYPCHVDPNMPLNQEAGQRVGAQPVGAYASIDTKPGIATVQLLRSGSGKEASDVAMTVTQNSGAYSPPVLFALSEWYYKRGHIDAAILWFNAAGLRGRFDGSICTDPSAMSAIAELSQRMPADIYRQQFQDLSRIRQIVDKVIEWDANTPATYDHRWIALHGLKALNAGLGTGVANGPLTVPEAQWAQIAADNRAKFRAQMLQHADAVERSSGR